MAQQDQQVGRQIFNANLDITNITPKKDIDKILLNTFEYIAKTLEDHCGPYGGFAIINDPLRPTEEPMFTKDGINIVRNLEFASPMQEFVKKNLAYVGSRIESAAGDGTTSAMIMAAVAQRELIKRLEKTKNAYSYKNLVDAFDAMVEKLEEHYRDNITTLDEICSHNIDSTTRKEVIKYIAWNQAYTSAHGDREVADAIVKIFTTTPESAWDYMFLMRERFETKQRVNIVLDETQYTIDRCDIHRNDQMTEAMGTKCIRKDIPFIASSFNLTEGDYDVQPLIARIKDDIVNKKPLVVLAPSLGDNATKDMISDLMIGNPEHQVAIFYTDAHDPVVNDIIIVRLLMGDDLGQPFHEGICDLEYDGEKLMLNGLYENPDGDIEHPYTKDKIKYPQFNEILKHIEGVIAEQKKDVASSQSNYYLERFNKYRNKMFLTKRVFVKVGGSAHDNVSGVDVMMDAILATRHSLKKGFVLGGNRELYKALELIHDTYSAETKYQELWKIFAKSLRIAIETVFKSTCKHFKSKRLRNKKINYSSFDILHPEVAEVNIWEHMFTGDFSIPTQEPFYGVIIQPSPVDIEIVKRFGEFSLKFAYSRKIVTPGGVVLNPEKRVN